MSGVPTFLHDMRSETGLALEHAVHQAFQSTARGDIASFPAPSPERARKPSKPFKRPIRKSLTRGSTSSTANTMPLERRRLLEKPTVVPKEAALPVLTKQGLLSRVSIYKEKVCRVSGKHPLQKHPNPSSRFTLTIFRPALCDHLSIAHAEYIIGDKNQDGVRFVAENSP